MNEKLIKIVGFIATGVGIGLTLVTDWVNDKKMDEKIEEKINKALADRENNEEEES